jgi:serine/threonine-protein kinase
VIGTKIGNYCVVEQIGEGGMGAVYSAKHTLLDKTVAVKVLLPQYSSNEEVVSRFFNEAKATTMVDHPGIVELYDFGHLDDGRAYIIMELLVGESLDDRIDKVGRMPFTEAARVVHRIAGILSAAHDHDIVHRDIKPENIYLVPDPGVEERERPKVLDFGIAKLNDESNPNALSKVKTRTGSIIGSPLYMSPEQCRGAGRVDHRSDIYSLGCILFELLCGGPPLDGEGAGEIIGAHLHVQPPNPAELVSSIPAGLGAVVLKSLAKKPDERYQSMEAFAAALRKYARATIGSRSAESGGTTPWGQPSIATPPPADPLSKTDIPVLDEGGPRKARDRTPVPTTLGLSTESGIQSPGTEGRRSRLLTMLAAGALAAGGVAYFQMSRVDKSEPKAAAGDTDGNDEGEATAPLVPAEAAQVALRIESDPKGAAVHDSSDDALLGYAPLDLEKPLGEGTLELLIRHPGHLDTPLSLSLAADTTKMVKLAVVPPESNPSGEVVAAKAKSKGKNKSKNKSKSKSKSKNTTPKAEPKEKGSPLTQPKAKTKRAGDGALDPFNK